MNTDNSNSYISENMQNLLENQSTEVVDLWENVSKKKNYIALLKQQLQKEEHDMNKSKENLQSICNHNWIRNPPEYQTRTSWTCGICEEFTFYKPEK